MLRTLILTISLISTTMITFAQDDQELPSISQSNRLAFFIPSTVWKQYGLEQGQTDEWMIVYNNSVQNAPIMRVNDIRWQGSSANNAREWFDQNAMLLGEGASDITKTMSKPIGVDRWVVYGANEEMQKMMKSLGVDMNQYNFTFTVDQYVAKIFVSTSDKVTLQDAWKFAKEGLRATLTAAGKKKLADQLP